MDRTGCRESVANEARNCSSIPPAQAVTQIDDSFEAGDTITFIPYLRKSPITDVIRKIEIKRDDEGDNEFHLHTVGGHSIDPIAFFRFSTTKKNLEPSSPKWQSNHAESSIAAAIPSCLDYETVAALKGTTNLDQSWQREQDKNISLGQRQMTIQTRTQTLNLQLIPTKDARASTGREETSCFSFGWTVKCLSILRRHTGHHVGRKCVRGKKEQQP